jgi:selenium metabolism protein YedF
MPLVLAKKELDAGCTELSVAVDNDTAVKNLTRLGARKGLQVTVASIDRGFMVMFGDKADTRLAPGDATEAASGVSTASGVDASGTVAGHTAASFVADTRASTAHTSGYSVFIGKDQMGGGDFEIGHSLLKMAIYTLSELDEVPVSVLFMNSGVKLPTGTDAQVIDNLKALEAKGTEVLVCGACLDYYRLKDLLKVGEVSNMYDILERMREASKVITL